MKRFLAILGLVALVALLCIDWIPAKSVAVPCPCVNGQCQPLASRSVVPPPERARKVFAPRQAPMVDLATYLAAAQASRFAIEPDGKTRVGSMARYDNHWLTTMGFVHLVNRATKVIVLTPDVATDPASHDMCFVLLDSWPADIHVGDQVSVVGHGTSKNAIVDATAKKVTCEPAGLRQRRASRRRCGR